jgi:hypothetical protein
MPDLNNLCSDFDSAKCKHNLHSRFGAKSGAILTTDHRSKLMDLGNIPASASKVKSDLEGFGKVKCANTKMMEKRPLR